MAKAPKAGERICPKCKEAIKVDASICKHCGTVFSEEEVAVAKAAAKKTTRQAGIGCLVLVLFLGCCSYVMGKGEPEAAIPDKPTASAKADAAKFYHGVMAAIRPCDAASAGVADAGKSGDLVSLYSAADAMETACLGTSSDIREVKVPSSVGQESHKKLTETREVCENAYVQKWSGAKKMKEALDSDGKISAMAELKESANLIQAGTMVCAAGLVGEVMNLGVTESEMKAN